MTQVSKHVEELQELYRKITDSDVTTDDSKKIVSAIIKDHKKTLGLLYQLLPPKIVSRLRHGEQILPESFDNVTIFFSDIVGFTKIASGLDPPQVIALLNEIYLVMDYTASLFPIFKVFRYYHHRNNHQIIIIY